MTRPYGSSKIPIAILTHQGYINNTRDGRFCMKPALIQDTDFMIEKTYHLAPYLGPI